MIRFDLNAGMTSQINSALGAPCDASSGAGATSVRQPRVLFVNHTGMLGGGELTLLEVARMMRDRCEVLLLSDGPFRPALEAAGVRTTVQGGGSPLLAMRRDQGGGIRVAAAAARSALGVARRARRFDLIYANSQKAFVVAAAAGKFARRPVLWYLHDILSPANFSRNNLRVVVGLANVACARVLGNSQATLHAFRREGGREGLAHLAYPGIDPREYLGVSRREVERARASISPHPGPVIGVFSRLAPWKGQHVVLDAAARLPEVQIALVGEALFGEHDYAEALRARAQALGIADRVHFLGFRSDVPALMQAVDVVVHSSISPEPFGRVIVEGMLAARPVIATRAGGAVEILQHGRTGLLVGPGSSAELAREVGRLLHDPDQRRQLGWEARADAIRRFSLAPSLATLDAHIREVARARLGSMRRVDRE